MAPTLMASPDHCHRQILEPHRLERSPGFVVLTQYPSRFVVDKTEISIGRALLHALTQRIEKEPCRPGLSRPIVSTVRPRHTVERRHIASGVVAVRLACGARERL